MECLVNSFICQVCGASYSRLEHLKRHLSSKHFDGTSHQCSHCSKPFRRKDVLKRHLTTCGSNSARRSRIRYRERGKVNVHSELDQVGDRAALIESVVEDKAKLCLNQVHVVQQGTEAPSTKSASPATIELYHGYRDDTTPTILASDAAKHQRNSSQLTNSCSALTTKSVSAMARTFTVRQPNPDFPPLPPTANFDFLFNFTKGYNLRRCFRSTDIKPQWLAPRKHCRSGESSPALGCRRDESLPFGFTKGVGSNSCGDGTLKAGDAVDEAAHDSICDYTVDHFQPSPGALTILQKLIQVKIWLKVLAGEWTTLQELRYTDFFNIENVSTLLDLYWSMWHPHWPVLHRPTFSPEACPPTLLITMMLMGSSHAPDPNIRADGRYWFDAVENLAFQCLELGNKVDDLRIRIQNIQTAYLTCLCQNWDGDPSSRTRVRQQRFHRIVSAVRSLDTSTIKHSTYSKEEVFDWVSFVQTEEVIRTVLWVFLLDTAFVIFNGMPPHFALRELRVGLASCEAAYQAPDPKSCLHKLTDWNKHINRRPGESLYSLIRLFFNGELEQHTLDGLAHESFLNLWCAVSSFHVVIFNIDPDLGGIQQMERAHQAVENWQAVWHQRLRNNDEQFFDPLVTTQCLAKPLGVSNIHDTDLWKRPGFWKNAAEYWLLAKLFLDRMMSTQDSLAAADELSGRLGQHRIFVNHVTDVIEDGDMKSLHFFLSTVRAES